ncbi:response regulator FixJ [Caulobacter sp. 17J65-9]|uniref:response regulator FixJ n=1 Tax=Caulobacter sp. 17J65-9 TaxID=2709382 RepID=UPI0013CDDAE7|nr:response regulator FixJ [Caulobacter sp. 17J65-9]NEX92001.1 response regulator [Caulobacter sp. 17J65-9]
MTEPVVHVVDDDAAVRDSIAFLLESAGLKARTWDAATALLDAYDELEPGCVVTDVRMPQMNGVELVRRLKTLGAPHPIVMITGHADVPLAVEAMKAGVADFIEKPFDDELLLAAVRAALTQREGLERQDAERAAVRERLDALSGRERQVLDGLVAGKANKVIAFDLGISPRTVEIYRAHVMSKMQAGSLSELVRMALAAG